MSIFIPEDVFSRELQYLLSDPVYACVKSVSGPGRSGAVASVYASHLLNVPWLPQGTKVPEHLRPHLVIDTAVMSGATLRKAGKHVGAEFTLAVFSENLTGRVRFWYETLLRPTI
jgi:hypothetical protein